MEFLGEFFLNNISEHIQQHQSLYVGGAFKEPLTDTTWFVLGGQRAQPHPQFTCTAEECDTRLWYHVKKTVCKQMLILSPDTDVYHIGAPLAYKTPGKHIIVQINKLSSRELKYLDINAYNEALTNDPDLRYIDKNLLPTIMQSVYVCTGCDYISFFNQIGKATFLKHFYQHASFVTSGKNPSTPGTLADISLTENSYKTGFLAFMRLVGTAYFKKHSTGFDVSSPGLLLSQVLEKNSLTDADCQPSIYLEQN